MLHLFSFKKKPSVSVLANSNVRIDRVKPGMVLQKRRDLKKACTVVFRDPNNLSVLAVTNDGKFHSISPSELIQYCFRNKYASVTESWLLACKRHKEDRRVLTLLKCRPSPESLAKSLGFSVPLPKLMKW